MQNAIPKNQGGMLAVLGQDINIINEILEKNKSKFNCYLANDNSAGQVVISGKIEELNKFTEELKKLKIKNIKLPVSASVSFGPSKIILEIDRFSVSSALLKRSLT